MHSFTIVVLLDLFLSLLAFRAGRATVVWSTSGQYAKSYPPVSSNMAGWKIPELNGGFNRKIAYYRPFSIAMFDCRRVLNIAIEFSLLISHYI